MPFRVALAVHTCVEIKPRSERETRGTWRLSCPQHQKLPVHIIPSRFAICLKLHTPSERSCLMSADSHIRSHKARVGGSLSLLRFIP
jgi:hypothetical protein